MYLDILKSVFSLFAYWCEAIVLFFTPRSWYFKDVSEEVVLITGAGSGIGRLLAIKLAKLGSKVILWDVNKAGNEETAAMIRQEGGAAHAYAVDISKREEVYKQAEKVTKEVGQVTMLINNAGIINNGQDLCQTPDAKIEKIFAVNALAHFWTVKAFLPAMKEKDHGHIVCMASIAGLTGLSHLVDYCATKFANVGFMEALEFELRLQGHHGVHTTTVCPIFISTGMFEGADPGILPFLEPEYVAERIVTAIRNNQVIVEIPRTMYTLCTLKTLLPVKSQRALVGLLGCMNTMKNFVGRNGKRE